MQDVLQDFGGPFDNSHTHYDQPQQGLIQSLQEFSSQPEYNSNTLHSRNLTIKIPEDDPVAMTAHHCGCCPFQQVLNAGHQSGTSATNPATEQVLTPTRVPTQAGGARSFNTRHICTLSGCTPPGRTRSFGRKADLERHIKTMHSGIIYWCPQLGCERSSGFSGVSRFAGVGFKRSDKLEEHMKKMHNM